MKRTIIRACWEIVRTKYEKAGKNESTTASKRSVESFSMFPRRFPNLHIREDIKSAAFLPTTAAGCFTSTMLVALIRFGDSI